MIAASVKERDGGGAVELFFRLVAELAGEDLQASGSSPTTTAKKIGQIERCIYRETIETRDAAGAPEAIWVQTA